MILEMVAVTEVWEVAQAAEGWGVSSDSSSEYAYAAGFVLI